MPSNKKTVSVRLDGTSQRRVEKAARLMKQSCGSFLGRAGEELAHKVLLDWAAAQYKAGVATLSALAAETGLPVEEIVDAVGATGRKEALEIFLASCRTIAQTANDPGFLQLAKKVTKGVA